MTFKNIELTREEQNLNLKNRGIKETQNMSTKKLINKLKGHGNKHKHKKISRIGLEKVAKIQNISENELSKAEKLQNKSIDELREIARLRRTKNSYNLIKEDLTISLSKSQSNTVERNYMKNFNNSTSDDTYDDKVKGKTKDIRIIPSRLGNIVTKNDRNKIKKELYEIEKKEKPFR